MTDLDKAREVRFYVCVLLGYVLLCWGFSIPLVGQIERSVLIASGVLFCLGGLSVGLDINGMLDRILQIIKELKSVKPKK